MNKETKIALGIVWGHAQFLNEQEGVSHANGVHMVVHHAMDQIGVSKEERIQIIKEWESAR